MACATDTPVSSEHCPSCIKRYQDPRLLPCFHTLCLPCLTLKLRADSFPCPACRTQISSPPEGAAAFPVDAFMEKHLLQTEDIVTVLCDVCRKDDVTRKCLQCQQLMCDACSQIHARLTVTRSHTLLTFSSLGDPQQKAELLVKERSCSTHPGEKLRFYCNDCRRAICRDCKLTIHQPHSARDVAPVSGRMLTSMQTVAALCHDRLQPKLEQVVVEAEQSKEASATTAATLLQEARNRASEIKDLVDKHMEHVEKQASENVSSLEEMMSVMKGTLASLDRMTQRLNPEQDTGYPPDVIHLFLNVQKFFNVEVPCSPAPPPPGPLAQQELGTFLGETPAFAEVAARPSYSETYKDTVDDDDDDDDGDEDMGVGVLEPVARPEGRFEVFTQEQWKKTPQLSSSAAVRPHGFMPSSGMAAPGEPAGGSTDAPVRDAIQRHIGTIQNAPQATNSIQNAPQATNSIQNAPQATNSIQNAPQATNSIQNAPQATNSIQNAPQATNSIQNAPQATNSIQNAPQATNSIQNAPQATNSIQNAPQATNSIQNAPQATNSIQNAPQATNSIQNAPQATNSIQNAPQATGTSFGAPRATGRQSAKKASSSTGFGSQAPVTPNITGKSQFSMPPPTTKGSGFAPQTTGTLFGATAGTAFGATAGTVFGAATAGTAFGTTAGTALGAATARVAVSHPAEKASPNSGFQIQGLVMPSLGGKSQLSRAIQQELAEIQNHLMIEGDVAATSGRM